MQILMLIIITVLAVTLIAVLCVCGRLKRMYENLNETVKWHKIAFTDDLTEIANRAAYYRHMSELDRKTDRVETGIMVFDIDNFKLINEQYGHLTADRVLVAAAQLLRVVFEDPHYSVFRIGGDEFAVIAEGVSEDDIIDMLLMLKDREIELGDFYLSKGYSMVGAKESFRSAFAKADEMLYADKNSRK